MAWVESLRGASAAEQSGPLEIASLSLAMMAKQFSDAITLGFGAASNTAAVVRYAADTKEDWHCWLVATQKGGAATPRMII